MVVRDHQNLPQMTRCHHHHLRPLPLALPIPSQCYLPEVSCSSYSNSNLIFLFSHRLYALTVVEASHRCIDFSHPLVF